MDLTLYTFIMIATTIGINVFWFYRDKILRLFKIRRKPRENKGK
ncbi:hypothetical protein ICG_06044 [Bacillus cereus BAG1X1-3]|nr:hypothetical protein ICG_06044 [Bacillus cereus BAG1X1-3]